MSWIKNNKFLAALGGATLVGAVLLLLVASKGSGRYAQAQTDFETARSEVASYARLPLYPSAENRDGKSKAIDEYRKDVTALQAAFEPFRSKALENISPQDFTNHLKAVNDEVRAAFKDAGTRVPEAFFCGFESYKTSLASGNATGILDYQLAGIKKLMLELAKSGAAEFKNLHRPALPEEEGREYQPAATDAVRPLPVELTFVGPEKSVRAFISSIVKPDGQYAVIRSLRITNAKKEAPNAADAKFEKPADTPGAADSVFGGGFVLPGDETAKPEGGQKPAESPAPPPLGSSRILSQVLGNEEVQVFLRLDLMQFLPTREIP